MSVVHGHIPCVNCGYDMSGNEFDGRCTECGTPLSFSLRPERLSFLSDLILMRKLHVALCAWAICNLIIVLGIPAIQLCIYAILQLVGGDVRSLAPIGQHIWWGLIFGFGLFGALPLGINSARTSGPLGLRVLGGLMVVSAVLSPLASYPIVISPELEKFLLAHQYCQVLPAMCCFVSFNLVARHRMVQLPSMVAARLFVVPIIMLPFICVVGAFDSGKLWAIFFGGLAAMHSCCVGGSILGSRAIRNMIIRVHYNN